jgi:hypothetical protein
MENNKLNPDRTDTDYATQFKQGNALERAIMKFCPKCSDGMCSSEQSYEYSKTESTNHHKGICWITKNKPCPLDMIEGVILRMKAARNSDVYVGDHLVARRDKYVNPCFEENPKEIYFLQTAKAQWLHKKIKEAAFFENGPKCPCGNPRPKGHTYCTSCAKSRRREQDRIRKQKMRRKPA